jgi:hypothetical protein
MPAVMTVVEVERFLRAEFPQVFRSDSGLAIEAVWSGAAGSGRHFATPRYDRAVRFPARP